MEILYYILVVTGVLFIGFFLYPLLQSKGFINQNNINDTKQLLSIIDIVAEKIITDGNAQSKTKLINAIALDVVNYVESLAKTNDNEIKKQLAFDSAIKVLNKIGITPSDYEEELIDISIEKAVKLLPVTYKI